MDFILAHGLLTIIAVIVLILAFMKLAYYSVKKIVIHLVVGYIAYWIAVHILGIPMDLSLLMWCLMALFGPIPVIIYGIYLLI